MAINKYYIDIHINNEYLFWQSFIIPNLIELKYIYPNCQINTLKLKINYKTLLNPIKLKCSRFK